MKQSQLVDLALKWKSVALKYFKPGPALTVLQTKPGSAELPTPLPAGERLKDVLWKPSEEFAQTALQLKKNSFNHARQVLQRITVQSFSSILRPTPMLMLSSCSFLVLGISSYEGYLLLEPTCPSYEGKRFILEYTLQNFFASCVWDTRSADIVARSIALYPDEILRVLSDSTEDSKLKLCILGLRTKRSIVAGFMMIAQLLSMLNASVRATAQYSENVYLGREKPLDGVQERIIRLAGSGSDVTEISMSRYGAHILPIYENPEIIRHLVAKWSYNGKLPCFWQIKNKHYGSRHSWQGLQIDRSFMLRTTTGKLILCVEADTTNIDKALDLGRSHEDLSMEDTSQAFRMIDRAAAARIHRPFRILRVVLGDSLQKTLIGGSSEITLRDRIQLKKEADVLIDSKAPLLLAILKWCGKQAEKDSRIVVDAIPKHFAILKQLLEERGYVVLDPQTLGTLDTSANNGNKAIDVKGLPHLVYHASTSATINAVHALFLDGNADPNKICALVNSPFGLEQIEEISENEDKHITTICAGKIYDDYFRQVRIWTRMGYSAKAIQLELDLRFHDLLKIQVQIAKTNMSAI